MEEIFTENGLRRIFGIYKGVLRNLGRSEERVVERIVNVNFLRIYLAEICIYINFMTDVRKVRREFGKNRYYCACLIYFFLFDDSCTVKVGKDLATDFKVRVESSNLGSP